MNRNYWASIFYDGSADFTKTVQKYEDLGLAGLEVPQVYGSPFGMPDRDPVRKRDPSALSS